MEAAAKKYRPTFRQMKYLQYRASGMNVRQAAKAAGYNRTSGTAVGKYIEESADIQQYFREQCAAQGLTAGVIVSKLIEGLEATSVKAFKTSVVETVYDEERGKDIQVKRDEIIDREYADYATRAVYVDIAARLMGIKAKAEVDGAAVNTINVLTVVQEFSHLSDDEFEEMMQRQRAGLLEKKAIPVGANAEQKHLAAQDKMPVQPEPEW